LYPGAENSLHAFKNGVKVGKTILNKEQRIEIRSLRKQGLKLKELAEKFNVSESAISEVYRGTTWAWEGT
jgi:transcriptional regulator